MTARLTAGLDHDADENDDTDADDDDRPAVYGDAAYGPGDQLAELKDRGIDARVNTKPSPARRGKFSKGEFDIDLNDDTVTAPPATPCRSSALMTGPGWGVSAADATTIRCVAAASTRHVAAT
jgi:hypothetical protein